MAYNLHYLYVILINRLGNKMKTIIKYLKTLNKGMDSTDFDKWTRFAGDQYPTEKEKLLKNTRGLFWFSVNISLIYSFLSYLFRIAF